MQNRIFLTAVVICAMSSSVVAGKRPTPTWTDPKAAADENPDFLVQGEYGLAEAGAAPYGLQVVALGKQAFDMYILEGGLPGAGWDKTRSKTQIKGATRGDKTVFEGMGFRAVIEQQAAILEKEGKRVAVLQRIERKSSTLGAKPPKGAVVLFDGTNVNAWEKGQLTREGFLMQGTHSKRKFGSHRIHLEFRTPFKPEARGQGRGNSGHYVQGRYETQILDSFGLEGKINETGGIYSVAPPPLNMCFPPLSWQTYDVDFSAAEWKDGKKVKHARMTVHLNGVLLHDDVECDHATTASKLREEDTPGPVYLQNHGNPVAFRNIWVVEK